MDEGASYEEDAREDRPHFRRYIGIGIAALMAASAGGSMVGTIDQMATVPGSTYADQPAYIVELQDAQAGQELAIDGYTVSMPEVAAQVEQQQTGPLAIPSGYMVEQVHLDVNGATMHGEIWAPSNTNGAGVVIAHGYNGTRANHYDLAQMLYDDGFTVLLYDQRAHATSTDDFHLQGMADDAAFAVDYLREQLDGGKVGLFGHSMGGYLTARSVAEGADPDVLVTWGAPTSMRDSTMDHPDGSLSRFLYRSGLSRILHIPFGKEFIKVDSVGNLVNEIMDPVQPNLKEITADIEVPYTIIHGTDDDVVPMHNAEAIHQASGERAELLLVPGGHHLLDPTDPMSGDTGTRRVAMDAAVGRFVEHLLNVNKN